MSEVRFLVEIDAYDPAIAGVRTLYLTHQSAFVTRPGDTPAHQTFDVALAQPLAMQRRLQALAGGSVKPSVGDIVVNNADGTYDAWEGYAFDGREVRVRMGPMVQGAFPADYPVIATALLDRADVVGNVVRLRVRDEIAAALQQPLQDELFAGDNVPPDGLEGEADLEGQRKPLVLGKVRNIPLTLVNAQKLIYQMSSGPLADVNGVYDAGIRLGAYAPVDWTQVDTLPANTLLVSGASNGATALTGGAEGVWFSSLTPVIYRSTDSGATWALVGSLPFSADYYVASIAYSEDLDLWVAVATHMDYSTSPYPASEIATSADGGATWTSRTPAVAFAHLFSVRWCKRRKKFYLVGAIVDGTPQENIVHESSDGITYSALFLSTTTASFNDIAVDGPALLLVDGAGGGFVWVSDDDGATFTRLSVPGASAMMDSIRYVAAGQVYVRVTPSTKEAHRSINGRTWTAVALSPDAGAFPAYRVLEADGLVLAVGISGNFVSKDFGLTWSPAPGRASIGNSTCVIPCDDRWLHVGLEEIWRSGAPSAYGSLADLEDDDLAPLAGSYKYFFAAAGSYVRLGSVPFGSVTADVTHGTTAADRTAAALIEEILTLAGYAVGEFSAADLAALDVANASEQGLFLPTGDESSVADAIDRLARSVGAWWGANALGVLSFAQLTAPSGTSTFTIVADDLRQPLERVASSDPLRGLPTHRTTLRYQRNWTVQGDGVATGVTAARRAELARPWREVIAEDAAVLTVHPLAAAAADDTCTDDATAAQTEATRRQALFGVQRDAFVAVLPIAEYGDIAFGAVGTLQHPRYGLSAGVLVRVLAIDVDAAARTVTLTLWR